MSARCRTTLLAIALVAAVAVPERARSAEVQPPQPIAPPLPSGGQPPRVRSAPIISHATVPPPPPAGSADYVPLPGVLHQIGERQTELTLLELDIKKAELQKKLRDLEGAETLPPPMPPAVPPVAGDPGTFKGSRPANSPATNDPAVRRIHKVGKELMALLVFPDGKTKEVRRGATLPGGLKVVEVVADAVRVRRGGLVPFELAVSSLTSGPVLP